jgi:hypothetical protein
MTKMIECCNTRSYVIPCVLYAVHMNVHTSYLIRTNYAIHMKMTFNEFYLVG